MGDNDHPFVRRAANGAYIIEFEEIFWIKKGKYYDLSPIIRQYVFSRDTIEREQLIFDV